MTDAKLTAVFESVAADAERAYASGFAPAPNTYQMVVPGQRALCGCAVGAAWLARGFPTELEHEAIAGHLGVDSDDLSEFQCGFDVGYVMGEYDPAGSPHTFQLGHAFGAKVRSQLGVARAQEN